MRERENERDSCSVQELNVAELDKSVFKCAPYDEDDGMLAASEARLVAGDDGVIGRDASATETERPGIGFG